MSPCYIQGASPCASTQPAPCGWCILNTSGVASGADAITVNAEVGKSEAAAAIQAILRAGRSAGLALRFDIPVAASEPSLGHIDAQRLLGTVPGVKDQDLAPEAFVAACALAGSYL